ncbi:MAG TPA: hypothetical protein VEC57_00295 [Candidatus Limnocylindrales bacterium]|nr:hypothetical protein [Candidatus Limnocylindrales bacterium]
MTSGLLRPQDRDAALRETAEYIGSSDFGEFGGVIEHWNLTQPIPGFPRLIAGSTYCRRTLEEALFPADYGRTEVRQHEDRSAVESPEVRL